MLPLMPITALAAWEPTAAAFSPLIASFSMYPLLERDGVGLAYLACLAIYAVAAIQLLPVSGASSSGRGSSKAARPTMAVAAKYAAAAGIAAAAALHAGRATIEPPAKLPWLWDRAFVTLSFVYISAGMAYFNWRQWNQPAAASRQQAKVKAT